MKSSPLIRKTTSATNSCSRKPALPSDLQLQYYEETARNYDNAHLNSGEGHDLASHLLRALIDERECCSLLDVGAGTGRTLRMLQAAMPSVRMTGIEPVEGMRRVGHECGLSQEVLIEGDATQIAFEDGSFDVVSAFGVLHHVRDPSVVIAEMLRVAKVGIFISDANRFAQGGWLAGRLKRCLYHLRLWGLVEYVRTRGKGFHESAGDGIFYSYSVFDNFEQIRRLCPQIHLFTLKGAGKIPLYDSEQIALFALKNVLPGS